MKKVFNFIAGFILKVVPVLSVIVVMASCSTMHITTQEKTKTSIYKYKGKIYRVVETYTRKVETIK